MLQCSCSFSSLFLWCCLTILWGYFIYFSKKQNLSRQLDSFSSPFPFSWNQFFFKQPINANKTFSSICLSLVKANSAFLRTPRLVSISLRALLGRLFQAKLIYQMFCCLRMFAPSIITNWVYILYSKILNSLGQYHMNCTHPKYTFISRWQRASHRCPLQTLETLEARICVTKSPLSTVIYS